MFLSDIPERVAAEKKTGKAIKRVRKLLFGLEQGSGNFMEKRNLSDMRDPTPAEKAHRIELQCIILIAFFGVSGLNVSGRNLPPNHEKVALCFGAGRLLFR
jgi:hypothetical protein